MVDKGKRLRPRYSAEKVAADMALQGWNSSDLARAANVSVNTVNRFLRGEVQTAKVATCLAGALGYSVRRYFIHVEAVA